MGITLAEPWWLLLLLTLPLVVWSGLRLLTQMSASRRWVSVILRCLLIVLVALLLARPSAVRTTSKLAVVAVIDTSESVRSFVEPALGPDGETLGPVERVRQWLIEAGRNHGVEDLLGIVVFDADQRVIAPPIPGLAATRRELRSPGKQGTDIGSALRLAAGLIPPDATGRIVLFSDGNATRGDPLEAARELAGGGMAIPVDVVPLVYNAVGEVIVESLDAPPTASMEAGVTLRVTLRATAPATGRLRLFAERASGGVPEEFDISPGEQGLGRRVTLSTGVSIELIQVRLPPGRSIHSFRAVFEPDAGSDRSLANNTASSVTITPSEGRVAIIDGAGLGEENPVARVMRDSRILVDVLSPSAMPQTLRQMQNYDMIVLLNVSADAVEIPTQRALVSYVREFGGGLVKVGGAQGFAAGGWLGSPLDDALPLRMDLPDDLVTPESAIVIIIDNSGSMMAGVGGGSASKMEVANESAARAIRTVVDRRDLVGVIAFNSNYEVVQQLAPNDNPSRLTSRILGITAGGGTNLPPALLEARRQLREAEAKVRHVLVLSDGSSQGSDLLSGIARAMLSEDGITVSAIAVGEDADQETMERMAIAGGGQYAFAQFMNQLPLITIRSIRTIRRPSIREAEIQIAMTERGVESVLLSGIGPNIPPIHGLVITRDRGEPASVLLRSDRDEPVLADWSFGAGRVVAFTSDAHAEWSRDWRRTQDFARLWTNIARAVSRPPSDPRNELVATIDRGTLRIRAELYDERGAPSDARRIATRVVGPDGESFPVDLVQTGPGIYEAQVGATEPGAYDIFAAPISAGGQPESRRPLQAAVTASSGEEFRRLRSDSHTMERIAELTGGRRLTIEDGFNTRLHERAGVRERRALIPIWRELLIAAIALLLLDIASRRVAWDRLLADRKRADQTAARVVARLNPAEMKAKRIRAVSDRAEQVATSSAGGRASSGTGAPAQAPPPKPAQKPDPNTPKAGDKPEKPTSDDKGLLAAKRRADDRFSGF